MTSHWNTDNSDGALENAKTRSFNNQIYDSGQTFSKMQQHSDKPKGGIWLSSCVAIVFTLAVFITIVGTGTGVYFATRQLILIDGIREADRYQQSTSPTVAPIGPTATSPSPQQPTTAPPQRLRLPTALTPIVYRLEVRPYLPSPDGTKHYPNEKEFTFDGLVEIDVECNEETREMVLHADEMTILSIEIEDMKTKAVIGIDGNHKFIASLHQVFFQSKTPLQKSQTYTLRIKYTGILNNRNHGFYRSSYVENNQTRWLATTQFESTDARLAMPCFDEPSFKAVFHVTIVHPADFKALSNTLPKSHTPLQNEPNWLRTEFAPTPKMSTYLLAFVVADFEMIEQNASSRENTLFRIWGRREQKSYFQYAADIGTKVLEFYENYFNVTFPLKKQDFQAGAMENWGLITYRESALLYDPDNYSPAAKYRVASVIAHELAHQWFGNLVTMKFWEDLWLNEGFATLVSYFGTDNVTPKFESRRDTRGEIPQITPMAQGLAGLIPVYLFLVLTKQEITYPAMALDQLASSHPVSRPVLTENDISFDTITYKKGGSVLAMIRSVIGEEVFRKGLEQYLKRHEYGNAELRDLTAALTEAVSRESSPRLDWRQKPLNVTEFAQGWLLQMGFPVLNVKRVANGVEISQERFKGNREAVDDPRYDSPFGYKWNVPVWYQTTNADAKEQFVWLTPESSSQTIVAARDELMVLNPGVRAFVRVNYEGSDWLRIREQLATNHSVFSPKTRSQLLDDAFELAKSGQLPYDTALSLTCYLRNETDFLPWSTALSKLSFFRNLFLLTPDYDDLRSYLLQQVLAAKAVLDANPTRLNDPDNVLAHNLDAKLERWACEVGSPACLAKSRASFEQYLTTCANNISSACGNPITPNLRDTVYCFGIKQAGQEEWLKLWELYLREPVYREKLSLLGALGCTQYIPRIVWLMDKTLEAQDIRIMDLRTVTSSIQNDPVGKLLAWNYLQSNWKDIAAKFAQLKFGGVSSFIGIATSGFSSESQAKDLERFIEENASEIGKGLPDVKQQLEVVKTKVEWNRKHRGTVLNWLKTRPC